jgi:hypothetical protein
MPEHYSVGDHMATYCTQCQLHRNQTVAAMDGAHVATVKCTICGSLSAFIAPAATQKGRATRAKKDTSVQAAVASLWEAKMAAATGAEHHYTRTATYRIGDILLHEHFGKGIVLKLAPKKCLVLFQDQERLMASANANESVCWPLSITRTPAWRR